ncbi:hypothetical protein J2754_001963 [Halarchaeum solikamskense]|uniref:hypothetical protein n=1 Tax=Halarchaeum nitratireducens TaxID=489913 RepID=UPI001B3ADFBB|nr:hypothetical protein [Halarchaeum solikamskense]MBP2251632.1 hypothetical protein [Halarchaeum solikamskense]
MSDTEPTTGHPDNRHALGVLRGAIARGDVLELHGSEGSATIRIPDDLQGILGDVVTDLDPSDELRADGGEDVKSSSGIEHQIERQTWVSDIEVYRLDDDGNLVVDHNEGRGPVKNEDTLRCSCGREFESEELAAEHLRSTVADTEPGDER